MEFAKCMAADGACGLYSVKKWAGAPPSAPALVARLWRDETVDQLTASAATKVRAQARMTTSQVSAHRACTVLATTMQIPCRKLIMD
jgi:hypothetical protein